MSLLLVGTAKGLVIVDLDNNIPTISSVHFPGLPVSMIFCDPRNGNWWVGIGPRHWGEKLFLSQDQGKSWHTQSTPSYAGFEYRPGQPAALKKIWVMQQAGQHKPNSLWLGTEPGGLFYSEDGKNFSLNQELWNHPSRQDNNQWFGTGKDYPFIHSIQVDPRNSDHIYLAISCAGVFKSEDGGKNWQPRNTGLQASYLPNANVEIGHDPHQMLLCHSAPDVLWQQNHCGIFRTTNGGREWHCMNGSDGIPTYGFALAIDHENPDKAWVIPAESDEKRVPHQLALRVFVTENGGKSWRAQTKGLPQKNSFDLVLRHGLVKHQQRLVFGTNNGNLYISNDLGETWNLAFSNLASISTLAIV